MKMIKIFSAVLVCAIGTIPLLAAETTLPVTKVTVFSSGVAYYQHDGMVNGDADVLLKFKTEQINDILKSLVPLDLGGGSVTGVSYGSREPLIRALKSFGIDISGQPTLAELLKQIRGAEVIVLAPEKITGKILGVEVRTKHILPSNTIIKQEILNLLTDMGIKSIPLETISSIALADKKLNSELNKALALLVESRDTNRKPVRVHFAGKGKRPVRIGYICEAPIWKTSYRLILGGEGQKKNKALMQGWAIVENVSDFDWEKITLTLVSGRPISFIQDLYTPLFVPRPEVKPELYLSLRPQVYEEGIAARKPAPAPVLAKRRWKGRVGAGRAEYLAAVPKRMERKALARADLERDKEMAKNLRRSVRAMAAGKTVGELFSYTIKTPVSIPRRQSAMLPIVSQDVTARKVSIYNESTLKDHPLNGVWLTNDTGMSLLAGPITVFDEGTYAGDARIGNLSPNDKRLLSYAIDLKVKVDPSESSTHRITAAKIVRGVMWLTRKYEYSKTYLVKNKADKARTLVIEHPRRTERKLISPKEPTEKTPSVYRFETTVPAGKIGKFEVKEEQVTRQSVAILPCSVGTLQWYTTNGQISEKVRKALAEVIKRKNALTEAEREVRRLEREISTLEQDQRRARMNMSAFRSTRSTGYQRFAKKLLEIESKIDDLRSKLADARQKVRELRKALEDYVANMNVE